MPKIHQGCAFSLSLSNLPMSVKELVMLWIPPGIFTMGSPKEEPHRIEEDEQQFEATISRGFWLSQYPVTQAQWQAVMGDSSSHFKQQGPDCPVENVSWHQAVAFGKVLNGLFFDDLPEEFGFGLPTEAQWEYACRAGTQTIYYSGNGLADLSRVAWHRDNSGGKAHPVGEKLPNDWGLFDMLGNVFEWCHDSPSDYPDSPATDWIGSGDGFLRIVRGGAWGTSPEDSILRCAGRGYPEPSTRRPGIGFRLSLRWMGPISPNA